MDSISSAPVKKVRKNSMPEAIKNSIIGFYQVPNSAKATAKEFGMSYSGTRKILKKSGVLREFEYGSIPVAVNEKILEMWANGKSQARIGEAVGYNQTKVGHILRRNGIKPIQRRRRANSKCWQGGRWETGDYIVILLDFDDPMMPMATLGSTVLEHRLVLARHLGRILRPSETVHHIDGNPKNNEIKNLQLRQGKHGRGVHMHCLDCGSSRIGFAPLGGA